MSLNRKLIAVIDDEESVRNGLARQLRAAGYRAVPYSSAETFLEVAAAAGAACVLCDIHLDGITGLEFILHPLVAELALPVVLMTGSLDPLVEEPARELAAAFLRKPFSWDELLEAITGTVGPPHVDGGG